MQILASGTSNVKPVTVKSNEDEKSGLIRQVVDKFESSVKKVDEYTKPRFKAIETQKEIVLKDTTGNGKISLLGATVSGGLSSYFSSGIYGVPAGVIGGLAGTIVSDKINFAGGLAAGSVVGAVTGAAMGAIVGGPSGAVSFGIAGTFSGAIGTLWGNSKASVKDGTFGGGVIGGLVLGPAGALIGGVAGGIGGRAVDDLGRGVLGAAAGAVIGGATGAIGGSSGILIGALKGALVGSAGAVIGPRFKQGIRNLNDDIDGYMTKTVDPHLKKVKLKKWHKVALGATAMAIPMAFSIGLMFGPGGSTVGALVGGAMGAHAMASSLKKAPVPQFTTPCEIELK
ncbi:MAG TPA: hypothetical protein PL110_17615 [Candidatus Eremiobacteraeota bacterium]|nr:hypothetical protein [Candidatus Eremiobacteraeota bacterium]